LLIARTVSVMPRLLRLALALAAVAALVGGPAATDRHGAILASRAGAPDGTQRPVNALPGRSGPSEQPRAGASRGAPGRIAERLQAALDAQAAALLAGDEARFLAVADPGQPALVAQLRQRFLALRALQVTGWRETLAGAPERTGAREWHAGVELRYCFVVPGCTPVGVRAESRWVDRNDRLSLVSLAGSPSTELGPRPWEVSELRVAVGPRVVVAATPRYAWRLASALAAAEKAAAAADRSARWGPPPGRYLVYLAGPDEWSRWYGVPQPGWVAGYAMAVSDTDTEIILNAQKVSGDEVTDTLRHEFGHVVTLAGVRRSYTARWWLVEGIAEYIRMAGRPLLAYRALNLTRNYLHSGQWPGLVAVDSPPVSASVDEAGGRYGVAFLAVRCLAERYGEDRMLRFFDAVVRRGGDQDQASVELFGAGLSTVTAGCATYIRLAVR
jgi:hypothetical protein